MPLRSRRSLSERGPELDAHRQRHPRGLGLPRQRRLTSNASRWAGQLSQLRSQAEAANARYAFSRTSSWPSGHREQYGRTTRHPTIDALATLGLTAARRLARGSVAALKISRRQSPRHMIGSWAGARADAVHAFGLSGPTPSMRRRRPARHWGSMPTWWPRRELPCASGGSGQPWGTEVQLRLDSIRSRRQRGATVEAQWPPRACDRSGRTAAE